jgi:hypothetical protein
MRKSLHIIITIAVMLILSRFIVRIVDATVQIDDDIALLAVLVILMNAAVGLISYKLYKNG